MKKNKLLKEIEKIQIMVDELKKEIDDDNNTDNGNTRINATTRKYNSSVPTT